MIDCIFCGFSSDQTVEHCPQCGKPLRATKPLKRRPLPDDWFDLFVHPRDYPLVWIGAAAIVALLIVWTVIVSRLGPRSSSRTVPAAPPPSSEQRDSTEKKPRGALLLSFDRRSHLDALPGWEVDGGIDASASIQVSNRKRQISLSIGNLDLRNQNEQSMERFYSASRESIINRLQSPEMTGPVPVAVNGIPADRYTITGAQKEDGLEMTYLFFSFSTENYLYRATAWTPSVRFEENKAEIDRLIDTFREIDWRSPTREEEKEIFIKENRMLTVGFYASTDRQRRTINFISRRDPFEVEIGEWDKARTWTDINRMTYVFPGHSGYEELLINGIQVILTNTTIETRIKSLGLGPRPSQREAFNAGRCVGPTYLMPQANGSIDIDVNEFTDYFLRNCW